MHAMLGECPTMLYLPSPISPATPADAYLVGLSPDSDNPGYINASYVDVSGCLRARLKTVAEGGAKGEELRVGHRVRLSVPRTPAEPTDLLTHFQLSLLWL